MESSRDPKGWAYARVKAIQSEIRACGSKEEAEEKFKGRDELELIRLMSDYIKLPNKNNNKGDHWINPNSLAT